MATLKLKHADSKATVEVAAEEADQYVSQGWYDPADKDAAADAKKAADSAAAIAPQ